MDGLLKHTYSGSVGRVGFDRKARVRQDRRSEVIQKSPRAGEIAFVARFTLHTDHSVTICFAIDRFQLIN